MNSRHYTLGWSFSRGSNCYAFIDRERLGVLDRFCYGRFSLERDSRTWRFDCIHFHIFIFLKSIRTLWCNQLPVGLLAQMAKHCTSITEIMEWNHVQTRLFLRLSFQSCVSCVHNWDDLSNVKVFLVRVFKMESLTSFFLNLHERFFLCKENLWMKPCSYRLIRSWRGKALSHCDRRVLRYILVLFTWCLLHLLKIASTAGTGSSMVSICDEKKKMRIRSV